MIRSALRDERGAIVTDWVALSAGVAFLSVAVVSYVMEEAGRLVLGTFEADHAAYETTTGPGFGDAGRPGIRTASADDAGSRSTALQIQCLPPEDADPANHCTEWRRRSVGIGD